MSRRNFLNDISEFLNLQDAVKQPQRVGEKWEPERRYDTGNPRLDAYASHMSDFPLPLRLGVAALPYGGIGAGFTAEDYLTLQMPEEVIFGGDAEYTEPQTKNGLLRQPSRMGSKTGYPMMKITSHDLAKLGLTADALDALPLAGALTGSAYALTKMMGRGDDLANTLYAPRAMRSQRGTIGGAKVAERLQDVHPDQMELGLRHRSGRKIPRRAQGPMDSIREGQRLEALGRSEDEIWAATAKLTKNKYPAFRTEEGDWVVEFSDKPLKFKSREALSEIVSAQAVGGTSGAPVRLDEVLDHPELIKAFGDDQPGVVFSRMDRAVSGGYDPEKHLIYINRHRMRPDDLSITMTHEPQHAISGVDEMSLGGNPGMFDRLPERGAYVNQPLKPIEQSVLSDAIKAADLPDDFNTSASSVSDFINDDLLPALSHRYDQLFEDEGALRRFHNIWGDYTPQTASRFPKDLLEKIKEKNIVVANINGVSDIVNSRWRHPHAAYERILGETHARTTSARAGMSNRARAATPYYRSYDVPRNELLLMDESDGGYLALSKDRLLSSEDEFVAALREAQMASLPYEYDVLSPQRTRQGFKMLSPQRSGRLKAGMLEQTEEMRPGEWMRAQDQGAAAAAKGVKHRPGYHTIDAPTAEPKSTRGLSRERKNLPDRTWWEAEIPDDTSEYWQRAADLSKRLPKDSPYRDVYGAVGGEIPYGGSYVWSRTGGPMRIAGAQRLVREIPLDEVADIENALARGMSLSADRPKAAPAEMARLGDYRTTSPEEIVAKTKANQGYSVNVLTGEIPEEGLMVGKYANEDPRNIVADAITRELVEQHYKANKKAFQQPDVYFGTWVSDDTGKTYLDASKRFDPKDIRKATKFGEGTDQIAGYNVGTGDNFPIGNWRNFLEDPRFGERIREMWGVGDEYMAGSGYGSHWWPIENTSFTDVYGKGDLNQLSGFIAATAPQRDLRANLMDMSEYMRRYIKGEPAVQPNWRAGDSGTTAVFREPGTKVPFEQAFKNNLRAAYKGRLSDLGSDKVRNEAYALRGDPDVGVYDTHYAKLTESPSEGVYSNIIKGKIATTTTKKQPISDYQHLDSVVRRYAKEKGEDLADFTSKVWVGIREQIKKTGELFGTKYSKGSVAGTSKPYQYVFNDLIAEKADKLGITVDEMKRRLKAGDDNLLSWILAAPVAGAILDDWIADQPEGEI